MRVPMVPSGPGTLSVELAPHPSPRSTVRTRLPILHRSLYSPSSGDSQYPPRLQSSHDQLFQSFQRASELRPGRESTRSSSRPALSDRQSSPSPRPESSDPKPSTAHPRQEPG